MTEYEICKIADRICEKLTHDERFMKNLAKVMPKRDRLISASQAAKLLGVSIYTVRRRAAELGGVLNTNGRWTFHESKLMEKYHGT